jgi:glycosyltransferase involved in cell wall biosynthesis
VSDSQSGWQQERGQITVVMPALNEEEAVGAHVRGVLASPALRKLPIERIIVVDNGSTDATARVAREAGAQVVSEPRRGYGAACRAGVLAASANSIVLLMDADGSDDLAGAARVAALVLGGEADLAVGSRTRGHAERHALTMQQRAGNAVAALVLRALVGARISDLGPMRAIRRERLLALAMSELTYGWSTEMLVKAARASYRLAEVPVDYHRRTGGASKVSGSLRGTVQASWSILATIVRYARWQPGASATQRHDTPQHAVLAAEGRAHE